MTESQKPSERIAMLIGECRIAEEWNRKSIQTIIKYLDEEHSKQSPSAGKSKISVDYKFYSFLYTQLMLYGEAFQDWFNSEGLDIFFKWANSKGLDFVGMDKIVKPSPAVENTPTKSINNEEIDSKPSTDKSMSDTRTCPVNLKDYEPMYRILGDFLIKHGTGGDYLSYLEALYTALPSQQEKLKPLDTETMLPYLLSYLPEANKYMANKFVKSFCSEFGQPSAVPSEHSIKKIIRNDLPTEAIEKVHHGYRIRDYYAVEIAKAIRKLMERTRQCYPLPKRTINDGAL